MTIPLHTCARGRYHQLRIRLNARDAQVSRNAYRLVRLCNDVLVRKHRMARRNVPQACDVLARQPCASPLRGERQMSHRGLFHA